MKTLKSLLAVLLILSFLMTAASCYIISGQKMRTVKGTYKLTHYTYTPKHERKEGYTPKTIDYINDEAYKYETYLVVTGTGTGYYVHKDASNPAYVKEVTLTYEYNSEDSSEVEYVIFNDSTGINSNSGTNRLGVTRGNLNYTKNAIDYQELITKRPMRTEALSVRWNKVSDDTDLKYAEEQLGTLKKYDYYAYGARGTYELANSWNIETGEPYESPYNHLFCIIDTAENNINVTVCYATVEVPTSTIISHPKIERLAEDWSSFSIDGVVWTRDPQLKNNYYYEADNIRHTLRYISNDVTDRTVKEQIESRMPIEE